MNHDIFYAWQNHQPAVCRRFIRAALEQAARSLEHDAPVQDAPRPVEVNIDSDTRGVPGSPPVADTILHKIGACSAFVADLTLIPAHDARPSPNPNVLIEYGYALRSLGDRRIVAAMNTCFGEPEQLPFDIQHRRWPIRYALPPDADRSTRREAKDRLAHDLHLALKQVLPIRPVVPPTGVESRNLWAHLQVVRRPEAGRVEVPHGPSLTLEIAPSHNPRIQLTNERMHIVAKDLNPYDENSDGNYHARFHGGAIRFTADAPPRTVRTACAVTDDSRLHAVDLATMSPGTDDEPRVVPIDAVERWLTATLCNLLAVAQRSLSLPPPLVAWVAVFGVSDYAPRSIREPSVDRPPGAS